MIQRLIAALATFGSFITLVFSLKDPKAPFSFFQATLITVATLGLLVTVAFEIHDYRTGRTRWMRSGRQIRDYMYDWISGGGRVAVFSRSLGWIRDEDMRQMMVEKAQAGELTLVMPGPVSESKSLEAAGAEAIYYGTLGYTIKSRFTIVHRDRTDTAVAIGRTEGPRRHLIKEFRSSDGDPAFWLAEDLVEILKRKSGAQS